MALSKKMRLTVAAFIASVTLGDALPAQAQFPSQANNLRQPGQSRGSVFVSLKPQAAGAAAPSGGGGAAAQSPSGSGQAAPGGAGQSSPGGASAGTGSNVPGSNVPGQGVPGSAGQSGLGISGIGGAGALDQGIQGAQGTQGTTGPAAMGQLDGTGRLAPIAMESVRAPIAAANILVDDIGTRVLPEDEAAKQVAAVLPLPGGEERALNYLNYRWQSANVCHWPLYFEEPMLERHGQQSCPTFIQPAVSGTKFVSNLLLYPYKATLWPALESRYTLGHFRPGSPAPLLKDTLPWSPRAAAVQGAAITGVFVGLPW